MPKILVIDDEIEFCELCAVLLTDAGYEVDHTDTGDDALKILKTNVIDLVITDMMMPGMSAPDLVRQIKQQWPGMPIIAVTGTGVFERKRHTENLSMLGVDNMIEKKPGLDGLISAVREIL